eukprot:13303618-Ditylum_brightwellii.AAC.1
MAGMHTVHYYWSHGITVNANHTSQYFTQPKAGHKKKAALINMMGGKTKLNIPVTMHVMKNEVLQAFKKEVERN